MKSVLLLICLAGAVCANAQMPSKPFTLDTQSENNAAIVKQKDGFLIFLLSKPTRPYEYVGRVKETSGRKTANNLVGNGGNFQVQVDLMIKMAKNDIKKNDFKNVNGLILSDDITSCELIRIK